MEFWIRFLFSALVDADRLDSEEFCQPEKASKRGLFPNIKTLSERIDSYINFIQGSLPASFTDARSTRHGNMLRMRVGKLRRTRKVLSLLPYRRAEERRFRRCVSHYTTRSFTTCGV